MTISGYSWSGKGFIRARWTERWSPHEEALLSRVPVNLWVSVMCMWRRD